MTVLASCRHAMILDLVVRKECLVGLGGAENARARRGDEAGPCWVTGPGF
jgi:hypothetical protein